MVELIIRKREGVIYELGGKMIEKMPVRILF